mgnify:CR=1 FL=1
MPPPGNIHKWFNWVILQNTLKTHRDDAEEADHSKDKAEDNCGAGKSRKWSGNVARQLNSRSTLT